MEGFIILDYFNRFPEAQAEMDATDKRSRCR
jgi:hypothetical protein